MSKSKHTAGDGGPAFPTQPINTAKPEKYSGMSLRDWFAGQALLGMLAHSTRYRPREGASSNWHDAIAEEAGQLADAMLAERAKASGEEGTGNG